MTLQNKIFFSASKTYFFSSLFFPRSLRKDVSTLYAFVRVVDDFVDQVPADKKGYTAFKKKYYSSLKKDSGENVIDDFVSLQKKYSFSQEWIDAFFFSMELDMRKQVYSSVSELEEYIYGSAEAIGLCMARMMGCSDLFHARMMGKQMQLANMIRDVAEDVSFGRTYLLFTQELADLSEQTTHAHPDAFVRCMRKNISLYESWRDISRKGLSSLPYRYRVPIRTADMLYSWAVGVIKRDPFIVYRRKVKPSILRILLYACVSFLRR